MIGEIFLYKCRYIYILQFSWETLAAHSIQTAFITLLWVRCGIVWELLVWFVFNYLILFRLSNINFVCLLISIQFKSNSVLNIFQTSCQLFRTMNIHCIMKFFCLLLAAIIRRILLAGIWILISLFFYEFSLFYRHKVILYFSATLHNKTKIWRMFEAIGSSEEDEIIERIVWYWCWGRMLHKKHSSPS